jgi:hypothetical protein
VQRDQRSGKFKDGAIAEHQASHPENDLHVLVRHLAQALVTAIRAVVKISREGLLMTRLDLDVRQQAHPADSCPEKV